MNRKKLPIYVVDDDPSVCNSIKRLINSFGRSVKTFASASQFLNSVRTGKDGIVILDVSMPEMDGLVLQQKLVYESSPLKLIFISGCAGPGDKNCAMACDAKGFLDKPFDGSALLKLIQDVEDEAPETRIGPTSHLQAGEE